MGRQNLVVPELEGSVESHLFICTSKTLHRHCLLHCHCITREKIFKTSILVLRIKEVLEKTILCQLNPFLKSFITV